VKFVAKRVIIIFAITQMEFACAGRLPLQVQDEDFMVETIEYWSNAADDAFPARLTVASSGAARFTPAPGQRQVFSFNAHLGLPPGKYELWGALIVQLLNAQGKELVAGELVSQRMPITR
jgi:hypothetical protein